MIQGIEGVGEIERDGETLCRVRYQLQHPSGDDESRFTLSDGIIEIDDELPDDRAFDLEPGQELTLRLAEALQDGHEQLILVVEPYAGHRPDERYQVSIRR